MYFIEDSFIRNWVDVAVIVVVYEVVIDKRPNVRMLSLQALQERIENIVNFVLMVFIGLALFVPSYNLLDACLVSGEISGCVSFQVVVFLLQVKGMAEDFKGINGLIDIPGHLLGVGVGCC